MLLNNNSRTISRSAALGTEGAPVMDLIGSGALAQMLVNLEAPLAAFVGQLQTLETQMLGMSAAQQLASENILMGAEAMIVQAEAAADMGEAGLGLSDAQHEAIDVGLSASRQLTDIWEGTAFRIENAFDGLFDDVWDNGLDGFKNFGREIVNSFEDMGRQAFSMFAQMGQQVISDYVIQPLMGALNIFGSGGGNATSNSGGAVSLPSGNLMGGATAMHALYQGGFSAASWTAVNPAVSGFVNSGLGQSLGLSYQVARPNASFIGPMPLETTFLGDGVKTLGTPAGALGSIAGSLAANAIFDIRNQAVATVGGLAGSIGGAALGAGSLGQALALGSWGGPIGAAVGAFLGTALGAFGPKPSDKTEVTIGSVSRGKIGEQDLNWKDGGTHKDSADNRTSVDALFDLTYSLIDTLEETTGGRVKFAGSSTTTFNGEDIPISEYINLQVGRRDGIKVHLGSAMQAFEDSKEAAAWIVETVVKSLGNVSENVRTALNDINFDQDMEAVIADIDFITSFDAWIEALNRGTTDLSAAVRATTEEQTRATVQELQDFTANTERLFGEDSDQMAAAQDAVRVFVDNMLGIAEVDPPTEFSNAMDVISGQFEGLVPLLEEAGYSIAEIGRIQEQAAENAVAAFSASLDANLNDLQGMGYLNSLADLSASMAALVSDAEAAEYGLDQAEKIFSLSIERIVAAAMSSAEDIAAVDEVLSNIRSDYADNEQILNVADTVYQAELARRLEEEWLAAARAQLAVISEQLSATRGLLDQWQRLSGSLESALTGLAMDAGISPYSLQERLTMADQALSDAQTGLQSSDPETVTRAMEELPTLTREYLELSREYYGSSEAYQRDFERVSNILSEAKKQADAEVGVQLRQLTMLEAIHTVLSSQVNGKTDPSLLTTAVFRPSDLDMIGTQWAVAMQDHGGSLAEFNDTAKAAGLRDAAVKVIGGLSDVDFLTQRYHDYHAFLDEPASAINGLALVSAIAQRLTALGAPVPQLAMGGLVTGPTLAVVGEGPISTEAVVPLPDGRSIPVRMSGASNAGVERAVRDLTERVERQTLLMARSGESNDVALGRIEKRLERLEIRERLALEA